MQFVVFEVDRHLPKVLDDDLIEFVLHPGGVVFVDCHSPENERMAATMRTRFVDEKQIHPHPFNDERSPVSRTPSTKSSRGAGTALAVISTSQIVPCSRTSCQLRYVTRFAGSLT